MRFKLNCLHISEEIVQIFQFRKLCVRLTLPVQRCDSTDLTITVTPFSGTTIQESKFFISFWSWKNNHRGSILSAHRQYHYCLSIYIHSCTIYTSYKNLFSNYKHRYL